MIKKTLTFLIFSIFCLSIHSAYAIDYSGTYIGIKCKRGGCIDGNKKSGILQNLKIFPEFKDKDRMIVSVSTNNNNSINH